MDLVLLAFYSIVCALLGAVSPLLGRLWVRFAIGAAVGVTAAAALPHLRAALQI